MLKLGLLFIALALAVPAIAQEPLAQFQWEKRPVIVFTPTADDPRMVEQRALFIGEITGLKERDMVVVAVIGSDRAISELGPQPKASASAFRRKFGVADDEFAVVLVGKDGGEKARAPTTIAAPDLFAIIDRMPMRRREMQDT